MAKTRIWKAEDGTWTLFVRRTRLREGPSILTQGIKRDQLNNEIAKCIKAVRDVSPTMTLD